MNDAVDNTQSNNPPRRNVLVASAVVGAAALGAAGGFTVAGKAPPAPPVLGGPQRRRFVDKTVLITGATSGIGRAAAIAFASEGARVAFCGRREGLGREVESLIQASGGAATYIQTDVREADQVTRFVDAATARYGIADVAFVNAGISVRSNLHEMSLTDFDDIQSTNVRGAFLTMKAVLPPMLERGSGVVLLNSSVQAMATREGLGAYGASKRGMAGLTLAAALECAPRGVRVNAICPGTVNTPMVRGLAGALDLPDAAWNAAAGVWGKQNIAGMQRMATSEEMAASVLALASDDFSYLNGSLVVVDGGMTASL